MTDAPTHGAHDDPREAAGAAAAAPWRIRLVRGEEHERAGEVTAAAYAASYGALPPGYEASLRDVAGRVREGDVWVAADAAGDILGTVWVARPHRPLESVARPGETDFRQLAVAPAARGRGVGEALVRHVIALATERGSHRVVMNSGPEMTGAHALYRKLGFRRLSEREQRIEVEPGRWIDLLAFGLDLAPEPAEAAGAPAVRVERVEWSDSRAVALRERMDQELSARYHDRFEGLSEAEIEQTSGALAVDPDTIVATVLALDERGEALGHAALRDLAHDGIRDLEVKRVYVPPRARGTGASRALMGALERIAAERGASRLILQTGDRQEDAVVLYERLGYRPIPTFEPYGVIAFSKCYAKDVG